MSLLRCEIRRARITDREGADRSIDRWLAGPGNSRRILHGDHCGSLLVPGNGVGAISGTMTAQACHAFSARYLAECSWRPGSIKGLRPFGPHALRDLIATHLIRTVGIEAAARALFDTPETLRKHYARFLSIEMSRKTNEDIRNTTSRRSLQQSPQGRAFPEKSGANAPDHY